MFDVFIIQKIKDEEERRRREESDRPRLEVPLPDLPEVERDPSVGAADRPGSDPDHLAAGAELVQPGRAVGAEPAGQHVVFPYRLGQGHALQRNQDLAQPVGSGPGAGVTAERAVAVDSLP